MIKKDVINKKIKLKKFIVYLIHNLLLFLLKACKIFKRI